MSSQVAAISDFAKLNQVGIGVIFRYTLPAYGAKTLEEDDAIEKDQGNQCDLRKPTFVKSLSSDLWAAGIRFVNWVRWYIFNHRFPNVRFFK